MIFNLRWCEIHLKRNPKRIIFKFQRNSSWYRDDYREFKKLMGNNNDFPINDNFPCVDDKKDDAGDTHSHYFLQDLYVAQKIFENKPEKHVDVGSSINGFVGHVASFREIEVLDIRKMESKIKNVIFKQADVMDENKVPTDYCDSVSSLHALEHFGLGRYGDPIDPNGHIKGFNNITKMLKVGGAFYFSVPMGRQRIDFNAHRVFGMPYLVSLVSRYFDIVSFAYIEDKGILHKDVELNENSIKSSFGCNLGCAIFELRKKDVSKG